MTALLEARRLVKSFGVTPALRGVDLSVAPGEVLAVLGASGSGKSTLLHCLAGLSRPDAGEVHYDGTRLDALSDRERTRLRRTAIGVVFQYGQRAVLLQVGLPVLPAATLAVLAGLAVVLALGSADPLSVPWTVLLLPVAATLACVAATACTLPALRRSADLERLRVP